MADIDLAYFENASSIFGASFSSTSYPDSLTNNASSIFDASFSSTSYPDSLTNSESFFILKIGVPVISVEPTFLTNSSTLYNPDPTIITRPSFVGNASVVFSPSTLTNATFEPVFLSNTSTFGTPIVRILPFSAPIETPDIIIRPVSTLPTSERSTTGLLKTFKDLSLMFRPHPLTGDITRVFDYDSVTQALKTIIYTEFFERPFSSQLKAGSIRSKLFEINDPIALREIQEHIASAILKCEPRVLIQLIKVTQAENPNAVNVSITYKIRTFQRSETFSLFLERV